MLPGCLQNQIERAAIRPLAGAQCMTVRFQMGSFENPDTTIIKINEESRAQKPSLLLRPALLVWFEVRVARVSVPKAA
jgi:hypothetical protein